MNSTCFEIIDGKRRKARPCGILTISPQEGFRIELADTATTENVPALFVPFIERGERAIGDKWARRWVQDRICPPGRQNLGEVLTAHGLNEYDELTLLRSSQARSSQDDFIVREIPKTNSIEALRSSNTGREKLGLLIRNRREALELSQSDLARKIGIDQPAMSRIEAGKANVTFDLLTDIARHLEIGDVSVPCSFERLLWNAERQRLFDMIQLISDPLAFAYRRAVIELERYSESSRSALIDGGVIVECFRELCEELLADVVTDDLVFGMLKMREGLVAAPLSFEELYSALDTIEGGLLTVLMPLFQFEERLDHLVARANRTDAKGNFEEPLEQDIAEAKNLANEAIVARALRQRVKNPAWSTHLETQ